MLFCQLYIGLMKTVHIALLSGYMANVNAVLLVIEDCSIWPMLLEEGFMYEKSLGCLIPLLYCDPNNDSSI